MPNWCGSSVFFYSQDRNAIQDYRNKLEEIYKAASTVENDFKGGWLGDFVNTLLAPEYHTDNDDDNCPRCRGSIETPPEDWEIQEGGKGNWYFVIYTQTAWGPMIDMWVKIIEKHYQDRISIAFSAEECGMAIYVKHDPEGLFCDLDNYYLQYDINDDYDSNYFDSLDEVIDFIVNDLSELAITKEQLEGKTVDQIAEFATEAAKVLNEDNWVSLNVFEEIDLAETG